MLINLELFVIKATENDHQCRTGAWRRVTPSRASRAIPRWRIRTARMDGSHKALKESLLEWILGSSESRAVPLEGWKRWKKPGASRGKWWNMHFWKSCWLSEFVRVRLLCPWKAVCAFKTSFSLKHLLFGSSQEFEVKTLKRQGWKTVHQQSTVSACHIPTIPSVRFIQPRRRVTSEDALCPRSFVWNLVLGWYFQLCGSISGFWCFWRTFSVYQSSGLGSCFSRTFIKRERRGSQDCILAVGISLHIWQARTVQEEVASMKMKKHLVDKAANLIWCWSNEVLATCETWNTLRLFPFC